ncbi:hypothetical protein PFICI_02145 [Pestalotiopsis fici W106-1]|uniref:NmrA-like domain-containing protein n=1 Tax=Pestalotiopsis fici (strain W106-1 / CGMCC3.15140) TaxID=1229662 RepID=W3XDI7_PESFW|nr:uncharacterized protein PFICI_02145 [Pestalotiopsis fici W106-1]ETS84120.1 hypothetical protein PFICI_02145 [Pestalotiopsis fici W106-1]
MSRLKYDNVIVFGPTGDVGGVVAQEASRRGARVWLAMRRINATITAISEQDEKTENSIASRQIFLIQKYVVFLSSFNVKPEQDLRRITTDDFIAHVHAQVEIKLEDLNISHVALRPGMFASKPFKQDLDTTKTPWEASVTYGDILEDSVSPADVGRVGGAVLVERPSISSKEAIYLCGPQLLTLNQLWETVIGTSGREIKIVRPTLEEKIAELTGKGFPAPLAKNLVQGMAQRRHVSLYPEPFYTQAVENIAKYSGGKPTSFADYVASQYLG